MSTLMGSAQVKASLLVWGVYSNGAHPAGSEKKLKKTLCKIMEKF